MLRSVVALAPPSEWLSHNPPFVGDVVSVAALGRLQLCTARFQRSPLPVSFRVHVLECDHPVCPQKSYSRKRMRFLNPKNDLPDKNHVYPCPKCDKGLLKVHHHLCPCDMKKLGIYAPETKYGSYTNKNATPTA
jgi:hypothetical protein